MFCLLSLLNIELLSATAKAPQESILRIQSDFVFKSFDPIHATTSGDGIIMVDLFEPLMLVSSNGDIILGQAESWSVDKTGLIYTFKLRPDLKWSDGHPLTAYDFEYARRRILDLKNDKFNRATYLLDFFENVNEIKKGLRPSSDLEIRAKDKTTLVFKLASPVSFLLSILAGSAHSPVPKHIVEKYGSNWQEKGGYVSNGAYVFTKKINKNLLRLDKNKYYSDAKNVEFDTILRSNNQDIDTILNLFADEKIDIINNYNDPRLGWLRNVLGASIIRSSRLDVTYFTMNQRHKPFDDIRVRRALSLMTFRKSISERLNTNDFTEQYMVSPAINWLEWVPESPDWAHWPKTQRLVLARNLMKQAGYSTTNKLKFTLKTNNNKDWEKLANAVKSMWVNIYIDLTIETGSIKEHYFNLKTSNFDMARSADMRRVKK